MPNTQAVVDRDLATINASGELTSIQIGVNTSDGKVLTQAEVDAKVKVTNDQVVINTANITTNQTDIASIQSGTQEYDMINLSPLPPPAHQEGRIFYDTESKSLCVYSDIPGVTLNIGQEQHIRVVNKTGSTITNGSAVRQSGVDLSTQLPMIANGMADLYDGARILGIATDDILADATGIVTTFGTVSDLDTSGLVAGDMLYLSESTPGGWVTEAPTLATGLGIVVIADGSIGRVFVKVDNHISLPTAVGYLMDGTITGTTINATPRSIENYSLKGSALMSVDDAAGAIWIPTTGIYKISISLGLSFDAIGNSEEQLILRITGSVGGDVDIPFAAPRNSGMASVYPTINATATQMNSIRLQMLSATNTFDNVAIEFISFTVESIHIR